MSGTTTAEYFSGEQAAPRPLNSMLSLTKIKAAGFTPRDAREALTAYLASSGSS